MKTPITGEDVKARLEPINNEEDCRNFFRLLRRDFELAYHPDDSFDRTITGEGDQRSGGGYVTIGTGEPVFEPEAEKLLDEAMARCWEILGERIYEVGMETDEEVDDENAGQQKGQ
jgi:hypothetical protein